MKRAKYLGDCFLTIKNRIGIVKKYNFENNTENIYRKDFWIFKDNNNVNYMVSEEYLEFL